jgi:hypothetical protein
MKYNKKKGDNSTSAENLKCDDEAITQEIENSFLLSELPNNLLTDGFNCLNHRLLFHHRRQHPEFRFA